MLEAGKNVEWKYPASRSGVVIGVLVRKEGAEGWWVIEAHGMPFYAHENELKLSIGKNGSEK